VLPPSRAFQVITKPKAVTKLVPATASDANETETLLEVLLKFA